MKTLFCIGILLVALARSRAQTNDLTGLLQQGLFEEQANRNLEAAIADYQSLATQFDKDRQLAATAVFRLGECYRAQGRTNEAAVQYQRVIRDFSDQQMLATLSRQDLAGMGFSGPAMKPATDGETSGAPGNSPNEAASVVTGDEDKEIQRIQQMIQNSPDLINAPSEGSTPLVTAAYNGWLKAATYLLDHGADVNFSTPGVPWTKELHEAGRVTPLVAAVAAGNKAMTKFLIDRGADIHFKGQDGNTPLHLAAQMGFQAVTEALLANHADVNARNLLGATPLESAVQGGHLKIVQMLLAAGADVNAANNRGATALNYVVGLSPEIVQVLLAAGADPNTKDMVNRTPLSYVTERDSPEMVKLLLAKKADPNDGEEAPLLAAIGKKDVTVATMLLEAGADPNAAGSAEFNIDSRGLRDSVAFSNHNRHLTPLWLAISLDDLPMVELLLKHKANPNDIQTDSDSLLFGAMADTNLFATLLEAGADPNYNQSEDGTLLGAAIQQKRPTDLKLLLKFKADTMHPTVGGQPILFAALRDTNFLEALLDAGAPVEAVTKDEANWTPLGCAANINEVASVEILLKHGANPNVRNSNGATPLHWAAYQCVDSNIFELLLDHGADPNVRSSNGRTPMDELKATAQDRGGWPSRFNSFEAKAAQAEALIALLHEHGAMDNPPDWNTISVSRRADDMSSIIFRKGTNDWNHFTLLEAVANAYLQNDPFNNNNNRVLPFPDLGHVVVLRPSHGSTNETRITVNLLNSSGGIDCSNDMPLAFGDTVDIPERDHALGDNAGGLKDDQRETLANYIKGTVQLKVQDQKIQIPIWRLGSQAGIESVLNNQDARKTLLASSDLSRVKVTRRDAKTGEQHEWTFDCSPPGSRYSPGTYAVYGGPGGPGQPLSYQWYANGDGNSAAAQNSLWLCDGDVIEVPQKQ